jgi:hypothetical protein
MDQEHKGLSSQQDQPWTHLINEAVRDFVQAISDSSRQLAEAAERFAGESLSLIDDATSKAENSAIVSGEMAEAAKKAAADAQHAAESLQAAVTEAGDQIRNETRNSIGEALAQAREAQQASERAKAEIQQQAEEMIQRIERSSEGSQDVIRAAQQTTEEVRQAAERISKTAGSVDVAVTAAQDAAEQAHNAAAQAERQAGEAAATSAAAQQAAQEARGISARIEERAAGVNSAIEVAQKAAEEATSAAQHVEDSIKQATSAVEAGRHSAQQAQQAAERAEATVAGFETTVIEVHAVAEQTREVVARIDETAANATSAASDAKHASQAASEAAHRAEQVSSDPDFGVAADTLLERLENDYQLLTSLVRDLSSRISTMATVAAAQMEPETDAAEGPAWPSSEEAASEPHEALTAYESTDATVEATYGAEVSPEPVVEALADEPEAFNPAWIDTTISYPSPASSEPVSDELVVESPALQSVPVSEQMETEAEIPFWHDIEVDTEERPLETWMPAVAAAAVERKAAELESIAWTPEPVTSYESAEPAEAAEPASEAESPSWGASEPAPAEEEAATTQETQKPTLFGRVQVNISPVPDFDRLLNLDSALSRVSCVQTVTLADYAQEEVTFRVDLASPLDANDFARELGEAAGLSTEVADASDVAVTLRVA